VLSICQKRGRQPSPQTENYIYPPPLYVTMQVKSVAPSGMGVGVGVVGGLSEEEKAYYVRKVQEAEEIVESATISNANLHREYVVAVFEKIASPLFYLQSEKREEARRMRKKEASKGLAVEFVGDIFDGVSEWRVASETEAEKYYRVRGDPTKDDYECTCPDYVYRGGRCKHIEAVRGKVSPSPSSSRDKDLEQQEKEVSEFMDY